MMKKKIPVIALLSIIGVVLVVRACTIGGGKIEGQIVDNNGRPVEDALVLVAWTGHQSIALADSMSVCIHLDVAKTDRDGKYSIPPWTSKRINRIDYWISKLRAHTEVYKEGYLWKSQRLVPFQGAIQERIEYLVRLGKSGLCGSPQERKKAFIWFKHLYREAIAIAETETEINNAKWLRNRAIVSWTGDMSMSAAEKVRIYRNNSELREALDGN